MDFDFSTDIILENKRSFLRPLHQQDDKLLLPVALSTPTLLQYSPEPINTEELLQQYTAKAVTERANQQRYAFIIFDKQHQQFAGSTSFANISNKDKRLEIGWTWIHPALQQSGLNRNNKYLMLQYAFEQLGFERVEFKTDERNAASRAAIEKIGGQMEGILRSHTLMHDGYRRNTVYYSILRSEWDALKNNWRL